MVKTHAEVGVQKDNNNGTKSRRKKNWSSSKILRKRVRLFDYNAINFLLTYVFSVWQLIFVFIFRRCNNMKSLFDSSKSEQRKLSKCSFISKALIQKGYILSVMFSFENSYYGSLFFSERLPLVTKKERCNKFQIRAFRSAREL